MRHNGSALATYTRAASRAYVSGEYGLAATLFNEALSDLDVHDHRWPVYWRRCVTSLAHAGSAEATVRVMRRGVTDILAAAPLLVPRAAERAWLDAGWCALSVAENRREKAALVLAPFAVSVAGVPRRPLSCLGIHSMDRLAASLFMQGECQTSAVLDARLLRIDRGRAQRVGLELSVVRSRYLTATSLGGRRS